MYLEVKQIFKFIISYGNLILLQIYLIKFNHQTNYGHFKDIGILQLFIMIVLLFLEVHRVLHIKEMTL